LEKFSFKEKKLNCFLNCFFFKKKLTEFPVFAFYDHKDDAELHCDATSLCFGAVLIQKKGYVKFHPVFSFSRRSTETESKYHSFELETLANLWSSQISNISSGKAFYGNNRLQFLNSYIKHGRIKP